MERGVLVILNAAKNLYVPVSLDSRSLAFSILSEAMTGWHPPGKLDPFYDRLDFYERADRLGKERTGAHLFLGPEFVPFVPDAVFCEALYVFTVDLGAKKIIVLK